MKGVLSVVVAAVRCYHAARFRVSAGIPACAIRSINNKLHVADVEYSMVESKRQGGRWSFFVVARGELHDVARTSPRGNCDKPHLE